MSTGDVLLGSHGSRASGTISRHRRWVDRQEVDQVDWQVGIDGSIDSDS